MIYLVYFILYAFVFAFGICIGSFLNVVIYRLPRKISFVKGRSMCPDCNMTLGSRDLVPIFSFLFLKGKCRGCGQKISPRYLFTELFTGIVFMLCFYRFDFSISAIVACILASILIIIALIDFDTMEIPNGLIIALIVPAIMSLFVFEINIIERVLGFFAVSFPLLLLTLIIKDSFGGGDIKLIAVCGFILGVKNVLLAMFFALVFGGVWAIWLLCKRKINKKMHIPFGPAICMGVFLCLLYGDEIINWYLGLFHLI